MLREADIVLQEKSSRAPSRSATCNVCFDDDLSLTDVSTMDCGHCFCNDCEFAPVPRQLSSDCTVVLRYAAILIRKMTDSIVPLAATLSWSLPFFLLVSFCCYSTNVSCFYHFALLLCGHCRLTRSTMSASFKTWRHYPVFLPWNIFVP
jgi:hypothetical protein